jgi:hypothetical protein
MRYSAQREHVVQSVGHSVNAALDSVLIHVYHRLAEQLAHVFICALVFAISFTFGICDAMVRPICLADVAEGGRSAVSTSSGKPRVLLTNHC